MNGYEAHTTHQAVVQHVHGVVIRYRITIDGPAVELAHSDLVRTMPARTLYLRTEGAELEVRSDEWIGRTDDVSAHVLGWMLGHIDLRGTRVHPGARRYDSEWMDAWRHANPRT